MTPIQYTLGITLALALLTAGLWLAQRVLWPSAYCQGQDDARRTKTRLRHNDEYWGEYWAGWNQEMYGHPEGPQLVIRQDIERLNGHHAPTHKGENQ